jgi:putative salt-induced outer membrane protein YdiY
MRPKFKQSLMKNIALSMEFYYKPNIVKFNDYRIENHIQLDCSINRYISLQFAYMYEYNSRPVTETVKNTDTMFQTFLDIKF